MAAPSGLSAGYGDGIYPDPNNPPSPPSVYNEPPAGLSAVAVTRLPDAYSLDNFGGVLYAMTSADQRLLMWDPLAGSGAISGVSATAAFTAAATVIYTTAVPSAVVAGMQVADATLGEELGVVATGGVVANTQSVTASAAFTTAQSSILVSTGPAVGIGPGLSVADTTTGFPVGVIASYGPASETLTAPVAFTTAYNGFFMPPNTGLAIPGMTVFDVTTSQTLGTLQSYGPVTLTLEANARWVTGATSFTLNNAAILGVVVGMTVFDSDMGQAMNGTVASVSGNIVHMTASIPFTAEATADRLIFSSGANHVLMLTGPIPHNSAGANDAIRISGGFAITLTTNCLSASGGAADALSITGGSKLTLTAATGHASAGANDALIFGGNLMVVQPAATGRGPVPNGRCFVVTQERFLMIFGSKNDGTGDADAGLGRRMAWCDQENPGAWDYSNVTSQAGFLDIEPASPIVCAEASRTGVIFWTAKKVYASRFLGLPYIYNYVELADGTTPWSPQSVVTTSALTLWMSEQGVFSYDGTSIVPVACPIRPWIDKDFDPVAVRELSFAAHLGEFNEWWWFFPTLGSPFNTKAMVYNYKEGWFTQCRLSRSAGSTSSYTNYPIFADDFVAFQHEVYQGSSYANASMPVQLPLAETFDLNLTGSARLITVKQLIPDVEAVNPPDDGANAIANLKYSIFYRNSRSLGAPEQQAFQGPARADGYVDFRVTGRDIRLRIDVGPRILPFTLGQHLIDAVPRGDR